jgi:2-polyprenyl-6-methoxyphenol hydroxylase-like FAD-dependent oxidoreductase
MTTRFDAIIVGARCAGAATALLLARRGYRALVVDKATFPSDTVSTHLVHPRGIDALERWGLRGRLLATGCPAIDTYSFDFGPLTISGAPGSGDSPLAYCPRRTILDKLLVDAAVAAGAEVREGFTVEDVLIEDGTVVGIRGAAAGRSTVTERASVVIGADGRHSLVARDVQAPSYSERPPLEAAYYAYWSDLPVTGVEFMMLADYGVAAMPTHDGLTLVVVLWPYAQFAANKGDVERHYRRVVALAPAFAERFQGARCQSRFVGAAVENYFRKPHGPGWVLVGDAGYLRDPVTAQGITDAFLDAERCATALDQVFRGVRSFDDAMEDRQRERDASVFPMYEYTCQLAALSADEGVEQLVSAIHGDREQMDRFVQAYSGTISPAEFFAPESVGALIAARAAR